MIKVKTPGKLMIAGEFAVLEPDYKLIVTAVDRFVYVTVEDAKKNSLNLVNFNLWHLSWSYKSAHFKMPKASKATRFVEMAMKITYKYLSENNYKITPINISVKSELADTKGRKYGLGSSAAVVTSVVEALLKKFMPEKYTEMLTFKLASLAHVITQGNGSGADIAASAFTGMIEYTSFQAEWLLDAYKNSNSISELIEIDWEYLSINQLTLPDDIQLVVGWTGSPASTKSLVNQLRKLKETNVIDYKRFLNSSEEAVEYILKGFKTANQSDVFTGIELNRQALSTVGKRAEVEIETKKLNQLSISAKQSLGAGKLSGAGGGDCGIAFIPTQSDENELKENWKQHGITPLNLTIYVK